MTHKYQPHPLRLWIKDPNLITCDKVEIVMNSLALQEACRILAAKNDQGISYDDWLIYLTAYAQQQLQQMTEPQIDQMAQEMDYVKRTEIEHDPAAHRNF